MLKTRLTSYVPKSQAWIELQILIFLRAKGKAHKLMPLSWHCLMIFFACKQHMSAFQMKGASIMSFSCHYASGQTLPWETWDLDSTFSRPLNFYTMTLSEVMQGLVVYLRNIHLPSKCDPLHIINTISTENLAGPSTDYATSLIKILSYAAVGMVLTAPKPSFDTCGRQRHQNAARIK